MRRSRIAHALPTLVAFALSSAALRLAHAQETPADWLARCRDSAHDDYRARFCDVREQTIAAAKSISVDPDQNGGITVHGADRADVRLVAKVQTWAESDAEARELASQVHIDVSDGGGRIRADGPSTRRRQSWSVSFELWVPRQTDLRLDTRNGSISVNDVTGSLNLGAENGSLRLSSVGGDVRGETTNGSVHVTLDGDKWRGAGLDLRTTNGSVALDIPSNYSARLETGTVNGGTSIDFPITVQGSLGRHLSTQLGSGGPLIRAVTTNGSVRIRRDPTR